jgi:cyclic beta-1,2-glucan synthetase
MSAASNLPGEPMLSYPPSKVASPDTSSYAQTQTCRPAEEAVSERLTEALASARNWVPAGHADKWPQLYRSFLGGKRTLEQIYRPQKSSSHISQDLRKELFSFRILLYSALVAVDDALRDSQHIPQILESGMLVPRAYLMARSYLSATSWEFEEESFLEYVQALQGSLTLEISEIWLLSPMLQLCLLMQLASQIQQSPSEPGSENGRRLTAYCLTLTQIRQNDWEAAFSSLSVTENILIADPARAYSAMEFQSRDSYRCAVQELARYSQSSEEEIARLAVDLAKEAGKAMSRDPRNSVRFTHVGFYLVSSGRQLIESRIGYRPTGAARIRKALMAAPEPYYFLGVEFATFGVMVFLLSAVQSGISLVAAMLLLLLPCSQAALETINQLFRILVPPRHIPRLDFKKGIPEECSTVVAVPALLISKEQVQHLVRSLEIRYLGNIDANLYFALLTDPPDSPTAFDEKDDLAAFCSGLIVDLNRKYGAAGRDRFFHLHRNRTFNATENAWMGWERKRGKLLDLNEFILGGKDRFPIKAGNVSQLYVVKYVITLDADTQLPRGIAARLVGSMAHPLNRAVVDPITQTVKAGYGILQPRIGISVQSVNRSRLAYIYSGETGLDIYSHAVSDIYQDLFGEAIFAGKGVYDVEVFHQVLKDRFPSNAILSHDLIEGVYARTGLVSDLELVDDYPSHFSAYTRRKHRWIRGDWQILRWLFARVPDAEGNRVSNPLKLLSRWKILDNLRRSVIEAATLLLFLGCWFYLPGSPALWTIATVAMLLIPAYAQAFLTAVGQLRASHPRGVVFQAVSDFATAQVNVLVFLAFLPHQALVTVDAIARTLFRLTVTHQKLLEWETAAQSEMDQRRTAPADRYLKFTPILTLLIAVCLAFFRPHSLLPASPLLLLWFLAHPASKWLDRPLRSSRSLLTAADQRFLRQTAWKTWRFFRQYSTAEDNWLIPDNIQGQEHEVAHRLSTTNLGVLFNSQLAAVLSGMQTVPQFADYASRTMASTKCLHRFQGHLANWYDTQTLQPLDPVFVSSVDNGNLACCLWTLKHGMASLLERPLFHAGHFQAMLDLLDLCIESMQQERYPSEHLALLRSIQVQAYALPFEPISWCAAAPGFLDRIGLLSAAESPVPGEGDAAWWIQELSRQLRAVLQMAHDFAPWMLPEFVSTRDALPDLFKQEHFLSPMPNTVRVAYSNILEDHAAGQAHPQLRAAVSGSVCRLDQLHCTLLGLATDANRLVQEMDFGLFYDRVRRAISVGYSVPESKRLKACYDLLASEARSALFIGIAKNELPQEAWFTLSRMHTRCAGRDVLVSWSGTMFEYLMPALWLKHFPNTLVENSLRAAIHCQSEYASSLRIPWGISEGACPPKFAGQPYDYRAFGLPQMAISPEASRRIVITPYAGVLALNVDPVHAMQNLQDMCERGWMGQFGFYESVEYHPGSTVKFCGSFDIVHAWMAHHQGMILLSICNALHDSIISKLFHQEVCVESVERLLHELPLSPYGREMSKDTPLGDPETALV